MLSDLFYQSNIQFNISTVMLNPPDISAVKKHIEIAITALKRWTRVILNVILRFPSLNNFTSRVYSAEISIAAGERTLKKGSDWSLITGCGPRWRSFFMLSHSEEAGHIDYRIRMAVSKFTLTGLGDLGDSHSLIIRVRRYNFPLSERTSPGIMDFARPMDVAWKFR
jgi:hypothetical protein